MAETPDASPERSRMIRSVTAVSCVALTFTAASSKTDQLAITDIIETYGQAGFAAEWLRHRGCAWAVELLPPDPQRQPQQELPL